MVETKQAGHRSVSRSQLSFISMTNTFIAYTRVSTQKQGIEGVSLVEQRRAIESYARRRHLKIIKWHEERSTAAKQGRPVFREILR